MARLGYTYSFLAGKDDLRGLFMSLGLLSVFAMASYLARLRDGLDAMDMRCDMLLMSSGGTLMGLDAAQRFPIRLVESGPAGGAILAA